MFKNLNDKITEKIVEIGDSIKNAIKAQSTPLDLSKFNNPIAEKQTGFLSNREVLTSEPISSLKNWVQPNSKQPEGVCCFPVVLWH